MHIGGGQWRRSACDSAIASRPSSRVTVFVWDAPPLCKLPPTWQTRPNAPPQDTSPDFLAEVVFPVLGSRCAVNSVDLLRPDWGPFPQLECEHPQFLRFLYKRGKEGGRIFGEMSCLSFIQSWVCKHKEFWGQGGDTRVTDTGLAESGWVRIGGVVAGQESTPGLRNCRLHCVGKRNIDKGACCAHVSAVDRPLTGMWHVGEIPENQEQHGEDVGIPRVPPAEKLE